VSATTVAVEAAGMSFRALEDLQSGLAVYQDFTNELVIAAGFEVEPRTPEQAAEVLAALVNTHRFTLYEYFITDRVGHAQDMEAALAVLTNLSRFVRAVVARVDLSETTVLLTSDHGNIEDLSIRNHTRNFVPTLLWGARRAEAAKRIRTLADITPAIIETLTAKEATHA
jgi:bisphosphoglycerate-independent phosphoglycerate mutase (AlkP superfamily)